MSTHFSRSGGSPPSKRRGSLFIEYRLEDGNRVPKSRNWTAQFYVRGRQFRKSTGTPSRTKAEAILRAWMKGNGMRLFKSKDTAYRKIKIYFMQAEGTDFVKIGISRRPPQRLRGLQTGWPFNLIVIATIPVSVVRRPLKSYFSFNYERWLERYLHNRFRTARIHPRREWFRLTPPLRKFIVARGGTCL